MHYLSKVKNIYISFITISIIITFGSFLYLYKLGEVPSGLAIDEAPNGINAYSLLLTKKDEYGKTFPLSFKFSGTFSPPLYTYLTIPAIAVFGLNITAVRLVSAISGIFSILVMFLFLKSLDIIPQKKIFI